MAISVQGNVVLGQLSDNGLAEIFKFKAEHEGKFTFTPKTIQDTANNRYNNVNLAWNSFDGMHTVMTLVDKLHKEHPQ